MDDPYPSYYLIAQILEPSFSYFLINGLILIVLLIGSALASGSEVEGRIGNPQPLRSGGAESGSSAPNQLEGSCSNVKFSDCLGNEQYWMLRLSVHQVQLFPVFFVTSSS
ncbi:MAG: hypothetical protein MUE75_17950 [Algoriphagus sp.]|nr:hypothetical protein [Algoriphagus sp.]